MHALVPIIIIVIIAIQVFFFVKNLMRMNQFSKIFSDESSWRLRYNPETHMVNGLYGAGNAIFDAIKESINKYLGNNSGSVIDFGLLKDAVDRHCDSVENDISTQTPIPLYWGLAGTMAGVILGLWDLLASDAITTLMGSSAGQVTVSAQQAAQGIDALLSGVAWAMGASICGIILTTVNSILFKRCKLAEESGKNSFLAWMQSVLLPELPSDTSEALNNLVRNLNSFNETFAENTRELGQALSAVNEAYEIQGDIIQAVRDMDVMKMVNANVRVLEQLQQSTDKLEQFNEYLGAVNEYTESVRRFEGLFNAELRRIGVLEEIKDFFGRHKAEISKTTADADRLLQESLQNIKDSTTQNVAELHARFVDQSEQFKEILRSEKEAFQEFAGQMRADFSTQMSAMPNMARQLEEISAIPGRLDKLIEKIEKADNKMVGDLVNALKQNAQSSARGINLVKGDGGTEVYGGGPDAGSSIPDWMRYTGIVALVVIALACIFNVVTYFLPNSTSAPTEVVYTESVTSTDLNQGSASTETQTAPQNQSPVRQNHQDSTAVVPNDSTPHP